ncbi:MAG: HAD family phosphatase [Treponema sp.]|jgi:HAD superfamily hydrolase (TIGR01509 family)|nr:HAD family phosphatase [Treponema sp.]
MAAPFIPAAVIFDMDGLMLDTERPAVSLWIEAAQKSGWTVSRELVLATLGIDKAATRSLFMAEYGPDFPYETICGDLSRSIRDQAEKEGILHRPGLLTLLDYLAARGIPLGVATSTIRKTALWKLDKGGIRDRFTVLACGDEVSRGKPAPDIFLLAAERLGQNPSQCVGFEDSPAGLRALHAAGIRSVFIKDMVEPPREVLATVWRRCGDLAEAAALFG